MRQHKRLLTPIEIQSQMGGGKTMEPGNGNQAKIIRFYGTTMTVPDRPDKLMETLTIEDLTAAGFGPYRYRGKKLPDSWEFETLEDPSRLVHNSVGKAPSKAYWRGLDCNFPTIGHEAGYGWEAKWGAARFPLRDQDELERFMALFDYERPI